MPIQIETPELDKMSAAQSKSQAIGGFLEWLGEKGMLICRSATKADERDDEGEHTDVKGGDLLPVYKSIEDMLAEYFEIDLKKAEAERRAILDELRRQNEEKARELDIKWLNNSNARE